MNNLPPDGSLSGEQPDPETAVPATEVMAHMQEAMQARLQAAQATWRPACVNCLNGHKIAIADLTKKLNGMGLTIGDPGFMQAVNQARQVGAMLAQNPMAAQGMNGAKPDIIPPIRPADVIVNGSSLCMICFQPQKMTSLLAAPSGWTPGG